MFLVFGDTGIDESLIWGEENERLYRWKFVSLDGKSGGFLAANTIGAVRPICPTRSKVRVPILSDVLLDPHGRAFGHLMEGNHLSGMYVCSAFIVFTLLYMYMYIHLSGVQTHTTCSILPYPFRRIESTESERRVRPWRNSFCSIGSVGLATKTCRE